MKVDVKSYYGNPVDSPQLPEVVEELRRFCENCATFEGFLDMPVLRDGELSIQIRKCVPENPKEQWLPMYIYSIRIDDAPVGEISLRVGYNEQVYFGGNIGFAVDEAYRGNGYAPRACKLIFEVARAHQMPMLAISNEYRNTGSMRVCEKLGMRYMRTVELPEHNDMRTKNHLYENIYFIELFGSSCSGGTFEKQFGQNVERNIGEEK